MSLFITTIEPAITDTIEKRIKSANRKNTNEFHNGTELVGANKWLYQRQSFCRMISNAKIKNGTTFSPLDINKLEADVKSGKVTTSDMVTNSGNYTSENGEIGSIVDTFDEDIRKAWILTGGTVKDNTLNQIRSGYKELYSGIRNTPFPGITEVSVQNKGAFGSVREATIKYTCFNIEHLQMLEMLYMTPGVAVFLEWGWSLTINGEPMSEEMDLETIIKQDPCVLQAIKTKITNAGGHYDAMKGIVGNFTWSQREDGGYDCSTTMTSMADTFMSADLKSSSRGMKGKPIDKDGKQGDEKPLSNVDYIISATMEKLDDLSNQEVFFVETDSDKRAMGFKTDIAVETGFWGKVGNMFTWHNLNDSTQTYITWGAIEDYIITNSLGFLIENNENECEITCIKDNMSDDPNFSEDNTALNPPKRFKKVFPKLNSYGLKVFNDPFLLSGDPMICLLPGNYVQNLGGSFFDIISGKVPNDMSKFPTDATCNEGYLRNICINTKFVKAKYDECDTIDSFIMSILDAISDTCGQAWKFGLHVDETNPQLISIVDLNHYKEKDPKILTLSSYGVNSIVRDVSINTEVDSKMKGQIMFGTNQKKSAKDISTKGTVGYQFYGRQVHDITLDNIIQSNTPYNISDTESTDVCDLSPAGLKLTLLKAAQEVMMERTDDKSAACKTAMNNYLVHTVGGCYAENNTDKISYVILPVKLSFTLDGISGLKFGNCIRVEPLPARYDQIVLFTITNVSHQVVGNDWTTSVETVMRIKIPKDFKEPITPLETPADTSQAAKGTGASTGKSSFLVVSGAKLKGKFINPTKGILTSRVQQSRNLKDGKPPRPHKGIDIANREAQNKNIAIVASYGGVVKTRLNSPTGGNCVTISHSVDGEVYCTVYMHMRNIIVKDGVTVSRGQIIGYMGATGHCVPSPPAGGWHLHFEIRKGSATGAVVDPVEVIGETNLGKA
jgi:murein DD-endopeptidase MepM/ murein hydrolase activator NlpD